MFLTKHIFILTSSSFELKDNKDSKKYFDQMAYTITIPCSMRYSNPEVNSSSEINP